jgi:uncharacterized oligopeptide transporter (OPT) family protein
MPIQFSGKSLRISRLLETHLVPEKSSHALYFLQFTVLLDACAAGLAGDMLQDFKSGYILHTVTPRRTLSPRRDSRVTVLAISTVYKTSLSLQHSKSDPLILLRPTRLQPPM